MLEANLQKIITSSPSFAALAGTRLYPVILPEQPNLPAATFQRITTTRSYSTTGPIALNRVRIQFDCWGETYAQVKQLQSVLRAILEDRGAYAENSIDSIMLDTVTDGFEHDARLYRVSLDFLIFAAE